MERLAGRYELGDALGQGRSTVYRGVDTRLRRTVAIKRVSLLPGQEDEQAVRARALREARAAARLSHPSVVAVYDVVEEASIVWLVMELVHGPSLATLVAEQGPLSHGQAAQVGLDVLGALEAAHAVGVVHRDVKPANVLMPPAGPAKLTDFGVATIRDESRVTATGMIVGSPSYMAPEQATGGEITAATDRWSLGALLYFAVEGEPPFLAANALATAAAVVNGEPRAPERPGPLTPLLVRLLTKNPDARPTAGDIHATLSRVARVERARGEPTLVARPPGPRRRLPSSRRHVSPVPPPVPEALREPTAETPATAARAGAPADPEAAPVPEEAATGPEEVAPIPEEAAPDREAAPGPEEAAPVREAAPGPDEAAPVREAAHGPEEAAVPEEAAAPDAGRARDEANEADDEDAAGRVAVPAVGLAGARDSGRPSDPTPPPAGSAPAVSSARRPRQPSPSQPGRGRRVAVVAAAVVSLVALALAVPSLVSDSGGEGWADGTRGGTDAGTEGADGAEGSDSGAEGGDNGGAATTATTAGSATSEPSTTAPGEASETTAPAEPATPDGWVQYRDPSGAYTLAHPPGWQVEPRAANRIDFVDPSSGSFLRVEWTDTPGPDAAQAWFELEPAIAANNPNYERIRIERVAYRDYDAALWEFRHGGGETLHTGNLGMVTNGRGYALMLRTPERLWASSQELFEQLKQSFQPS